MLKRILIGIAVLVALLAAFVATRPPRYRVERSIVIAAPAEDSFLRVALFRRWPTWSPWQNLDPNMKVEFSGPKGGVGAVYAWAGNDKAGEGKMTQTAVVKDELVRIDIEFLKPWKQKGEMEFTWAPAPGGTRVTWSLSGENDFLGKAVCLLVDMDRHVGGDFERGLASLKSVTEAGP